MKPGQSPWLDPVVPVCNTCHLMCLAPCALVDRRLYVSVRGNVVQTSVTLSDGLWHFLCVSLSLAEALVTVVLDAQGGCDPASRLSTSTYSLSLPQPGNGTASLPLVSDGCLAIGQLTRPHDVGCAQIDSTYSYEGYLNELTLWSTLLPVAKVCSKSAPY